MDSALHKKLKFGQLRAFVVSDFSSGFGDGSYPGMFQGLVVKWNKVMGNVPCVRNISSYNVE